MTFFIGLYMLHRSIKLPLLIVLRCTCARCERICSLVGDDFLLLLYKDETFPLRWGFTGVGRKFDEEARNASIKGDASAHTQALWLHELCGGVYGSGPRNYKRERTRGMSRFSKTRRPKLRILMLDSTGVACSSQARKGCNGPSGGSPCRFPCCV
ncbi:hypothetical protein DY000_02040750 [Brassica cretica]|uniref:Secreted protein n=1 Tax=Brassica cretica TaxID=69181 RepID=A0ABQ7BP51_BRACR|nr:hypothetical protein DY000_02040750 [Brassica cretica]